MNIETFKTVVLVNLVAISLFLTYSLWTYQPDLSSQSGQKYIQDVPAVVKKEASSLIYPSRVIIHTEKTHRVSNLTSVINPLYRLLEKGEFYGFRDRTADISRSQFLSFVHGKNKIEVMFPTDIPLATLQKVFSFKEKDLDDYSFDRIMIDMAGSRDNSIDIYFISYKERKVYAATMRGVAMADLEREQAEFVQKAGDYFLHRVNDTRAVFLPESDVAMSTKLYITDNLLEEQFKNVLFTDPRYVKKDDTGTAEIYTDGIRLLRISKGTRMMTYENSAVPGSQHLTGSTLMQQIVDFINNHNGWSDTYRFDSIQTQRGKAVFRIYEDDIPVFNTNGMAALKLVWGTNELKAYDRPLFRLYLVKMDYEKVNLESGRTILPILEKDPRSKSIQDVSIGYELEPQMDLGNERFIAVRLKPIWYIKYEDSYVKIDWNETGGTIVGLEQN